MRIFARLVAALCMIGSAIPAQAANLQFCDDIKDDQARMTCLQQHIMHLEETIVVLGGRVAELENALQKMLSSDASYKLKSVAQDKCLGLGGDNKDVPTLVTCDNPDSWSVMSGAPIKKPAKTPVPSDDAQTGPVAAGSSASPTSGAAASAATGPTASATAGSATSAASPKPRGQGTNPCRNLDQNACAAKADTCAWNADKNKCARKAS